MPTPGPPPSGRVAWLDVTAGVAGDMLLGALVDAGADVVDVQASVDCVLPGTVRFESETVRRAGLRATKLHVRLLRDDQPHRSWREIRDRIESADLPPPVASGALAVFARLAEVEARSHAVPVLDVEFHEIGSWDSVADVVGTCAAFHELGVEQVVATPIALGSGTAQGSHGTLPVPVPAVLFLVDGWSVTSGGEGELATPTGVALVTTYASAQGPLPAMRVLASGTGAGTRDRPDRPNVVRAVVGNAEGSTGSELTLETMAVIEANIDDLDPRVWPSVTAAVLDAGAVDAWLTPILMKKGRPAHTLSVLSTPAAAAALRTLVLELTSTLGVRQYVVERWSLDRGWVDVVVHGRPVPVKVAHRGGVVVEANPEFDDVVHLAATLGRPVRDVLGEAADAARREGIAAGSAVPARLRATREVGA